MAEEQRDEFLEGVRNELDRHLLDILRFRAELHDIEIDEDASSTLKKAVNQIFENNRNRLIEEFFPLTRYPFRLEERPTPRDTALSMGFFLTERVISSALKENRRKVVASDIFMAVLDFGKLEVPIYPWS